MAKTTTNDVQIGSISTGTLRDRDLLPVFTAELERLDTAGEHANVIAESNSEIAWFENRHDAGDPLDWEYDDEHTPTVGFLINEELPNALNEYAPPHTYFGARCYARCVTCKPGADFGFWPDLDFDNCDTGRTGEPETMIDNDCGILFNVNDHGNVTVMDLNREEIWSVV